MQIGNLYRWKLEAADGKWTATAKKYRLAEGEGDVAIKFFLGPLVIDAVGVFEGVVRKDGRVHREPVSLKGSRIWITQLSARDE